MTLEFFGETFQIRFVKGKYYNNGNLYLGIQNYTEENGWDSFCDITVNFPENCPEDCGFLKISDMSREVFTLLRPYIFETGRVMKNGYTTYPEARFSQELLDMAVELK